jgi:pilus assembly protein Flp/PilA
VPRLRLGDSKLERTHMNTLFLKMLVKAQELLNREEGQDLVEYALLVALIALVAVTGVNNVAKAVNTVFNSISTSLA